MPDEADIHRRCFSKKVKNRQGAADILASYFSILSDKPQAWQDLISLTQDEDTVVRWGAAEALGSVFIKIPDKAQAWQDLIKLTQDQDWYVRRKAAEALGSDLSQIPDKNQAWKDLIRLTQDKNRDVRLSATEALASFFSQVPDKAQAWQDLIKLTQDQDWYVRRKAAVFLASFFSQVPDKAQAWQDFRRLTQDQDWYVRRKAAEALGSDLSQIPDKNQAWKDLIRLTQDQNSDVRWSAAAALVSDFSQVPDKDQAWRDLHRLTQDQNREGRLSAATVIALFFSQVPDKAQAWQDLINLTKDQNSDVQWKATEALGLVFRQVPDKDQAWQDLISLIDEDRNWELQETVAVALKTAFSYVPNQDQIWQDLVRLTRDKNSDVRLSALIALASVFRQVPDKDRAWRDLHKLTQDQDWNVRRKVAEALGTAFSHIPDKEQAWQDLINLTKDKHSDVRMYAYHSLGRASISKATETHDIDTLKKELEVAVNFFENSSQESEFSPARFCYPFYRSYLAITFQEAKEDEVQRYLTEAKESVGRSESKDELLNAVKNLAMALQESQRLKNRPVQEVASELNTYRWYCDKAAEHMDAAEDKAPGAVKLLRKCNPFIEERIQNTILEIQQKARQICQITRVSGTEFEAPGAELQEAASGLSVDDLCSIQKYSSRVVWQLKKFCRLLPAEDKEEFCGIVEEIEHEPVFPEKLNKIITALLCLGPILEDKSSSLADVVILTVLPEEYGGISNRLSELGHPPDMGSTLNLYAWKFGKVFCQNFKADYKIAVGMIGRPGTTQGALAAREAVQLWRPRYVLFCGIAGGLPDPNEKDARPRLGDVVVTDIIYGYEYGKLERKFKPRANWTYSTNQALLNGARAYALSDGWRELIKAEPPRECTPRVISGEIASGDQVVDDPTNNFFAQVLKTWPKINAVEMEGAGAAAAIEQVNSLGYLTGFMMIRGISDLPRTKGKNKGRRERDAWKTYASAVVAAFTIGWIADGLPLPPSA